MHQCPARSVHHRANKICCIEWRNLAKFLTTTVSHRHRSGSLVNPLTTSCVFICSQLLTCLHPEGRSVFCTLRLQPDGPMTPVDAGCTVPSVQGHTFAFPLSSVLRSFITFKTSAIYRQLWNNSDFCRTGHFAVFARLNLHTLWEMVTYNLARTLWSQQWKNYT